MTGTPLGTGSIYKTDLFNIFNVVQNTQLAYPKELMIDVLRDIFSQDTYYHYVRDEWGFPYSPDHTNLPSDAGIQDDLTTRLYIGEAFKLDVIYYPAILVRSGGSRYVPLSLNRNKEVILYEPVMVTDGYGNTKTFVTPTHFVLAGVWEGSLNLDVMTRGLKARDDLVEIISLICSDLRHDEFIRAGLMITSVSAGAPSETEDRNEKLYKQTITLDVRSEWRRQIPVESLVDAINICVDFGNLSGNTPVIAPNITVQTNVNLVEAINAL